MEQASKTIFVFHQPNLSYWPARLALSYIGGMRVIEKRYPSKKVASWSYTYPPGTHVLSQVNNII